jgi:hypothetical protein
MTSVVPMHCTKSIRFWHNSSVHKHPTWIVIGSRLNTACLVYHEHQPFKESSYAVVLMASIQPYFCLDLHFTLAQTRMLFGWSKQAGYISWAQSMLPHIHLVGCQDRNLVRLSHKLEQGADLAQHSLPGQHRSLHLRVCVCVCLYVWMCVNVL